MPSLSLGLLRSWYGRIGLVIVAAGYAVMASALVQYLLAVNMRRRMDFAISGGFAGVGLVVLGVVVLLVERAVLGVEEEAREQRALAASLSAGASAASSAVVAALPDVVVASANSYHRADCLLVEGRDELEQVSVDVARGRSLSACRLCLRGIE
jgi:hypothetical protein